MQRNNLLTSAPDQNKSSTLEYDGTQRLKFNQISRQTLGKHWSNIGHHQKMF